MVVLWTNKAKSSLKNIFTYIKADSPYYAEEVKKKFLNESKKLQDFPQMGRIVPELDNSDIRELFVYSYRMLYEVSGDNIYILSIVHSRQNFTGI